MNSNTVLRVILTGLFTAAAACGGSTSTTGDGSVDARDIQDVRDIQDPQDIQDTQDVRDVRDVQDARDVQPDLPAPHPITFVIRNTSSESTYMDFTFGADEAVAGAWSTGAAWENIAYFPVSCMADCDEAAPGSNCCVLCDVEASTKVLEGGEEVTVVWGGVSVYTLVDGYCECTCYRRASVVPAAYKAIACTYDSFYCPSEPCIPDEEGLMFAPVTGDPTCFETIFEIPYEGTEVIIEIM